MAWPDRLRPASFRGVPFQVSAHAFEGGRRVVLEELPYRDAPHTDDTGRKARAFAVSAYVIGDDYQDQLEALIRALEQRGPGVLVHPYRGTHAVRCEGFSVSEEVGEGRMARLELRFVEAGRQLSAVPAADAVSGAARAAERLREVSLAQFLERVRAIGVPDFVRRKLDRGLREVVNGLAALRVVRELPADSPWQRELRRFRAVLALPTGAQGSFSRDPSGAPPLVDRLVGLVPDVTGGGLPALRALVELAETEDPPEEPATSAMGIQGLENQRAGPQLLRELALARAVEVAAEYRWDHLQEALSWRARLLELVEEAFLHASDQGYDRLRSLRRQIIESIPPREETLPELVTFVPPQTVPAEVLAFELYGDAARGLDLARRGDVKRPFYVPGGEPLEVLLPEVG